MLAASGSIGAATEGDASRHLTLQGARHPPFPEAAPGARRRRARRCSPPRRQPARRTSSSRRSTARRSSPTPSRTRRSAPGAHAPTVLLGPGWAGPGESDPSRAGHRAAAGPPATTSVTFDPRGFGDSGGEATIDAPQVEGRDVSRDHRLGRHAALGAARPPRRPAGGHGRRQLRRGHPVRDRVGRSPRRRARADRRLAQPASRASTRTAPSSRAGTRCSTGRGWPPATGTA